MTNTDILVNILAFELILIGIVLIFIQYVFQRKLIYSRELLLVLLVPFGFILLGLWIWAGTHYTENDISIFTIIVILTLIILTITSLFGYIKVYRSVEEIYDINMLNIGVLFYSSSTLGVKLHERVWESTDMNYQELEAQGAYFLSVMGAGSTYREGGFGPMPFGKNHVCWVYSKAFTFQNTDDTRIQDSSSGLIVITLPKRLKYRIKPKRKYEKLLFSMLENYEDVEQIDRPILDRIKISFVFQKITHTNPNSVKYN